MTRVILATFMLSIACSSLAEKAAVPPIKELDVNPGRNVFKAASRQKPLEIRSAEDAAKYFPEKGKALADKVNFKQQVVLVFAWRGSGQDKMAYDIKESFPEQVVFRYQPGRTRDLRPHTYVYALRSNVKWSVK